MGKSVCYFGYDKRKKKNLNHDQANNFVQIKYLCIIICLHIKVLLGLSWNPIEGATSYILKRSETAGGPYMTTFSAIGRTFYDTNVTPGITCYYVVSPVNAGGESPNSNEVSATIPQPTNILNWYLK